MAQKVSAPVRVRKAADTFCEIGSHISTIRTRSLNVIDTKYQALSGSPFIPYAALELA